ncbi:MAG: hypothetical protein DYG92_04440 [Leptolyngbya sp. PLA1]|nr:hypothetical protein [Leptolyngbya sp. PLA1]
MSDPSTTTPTPLQTPPETGAVPPAPPSDSDLTNQIDSLLAEIDLGRSRLEQQAAALTSPPPTAPQTPIPTSEIDKELNELLREAGASVPPAPTSEAKADIPPGAADAHTPRGTQASSAPLPSATPVQPSKSVVPQPGTPGDPPSEVPPDARSIPTATAPGARAPAGVQPATPEAGLSSQIDQLLQQAASNPAETPRAVPATTPAVQASKSSPAPPAPSRPDAAAPSAPSAPHATPVPSAATHAASAQAPAATTTPSATSASVASPAPPPPARRLADVLARALTPLSAPFASKPKVVRESLGWVAANTVFLGACLWVYIEFFRPDPKVAHTDGTFDFAHDEVPAVPEPGPGSKNADSTEDHKQEATHGADPKAKSGAHGTEKKSAAKKPDAKKADPHAKTTKSGH